MIRLLPNRLRLVNAVLVLMLFGATVKADALPINETLSPGDTLYVRFQLTDMGLFPDPFNGVGTDFGFSGQVINFTFQLNLYDDTDTIVGGFGPQFAPNGYGLGPTYVDVSLGGGPASGGSRTPADLASYLDGNGMASFTLVSGPDVTVTDFEPLFGYHSGNTGSSPIIPHIQSYAVNQLPGAVPEPTAAVVLSLAGVALLGQRERR
jgi:hypothetical protein